MSELNLNTPKILSNDEAREAYNSTNQRLICRNEDFDFMTGSKNSSSFLTRVKYWENVMWKKKKCGKFYKVDSEWCSELNLSIDEVKSARKKLVELGYITVKREGKLGINHYYVNHSKILQDQDALHEGRKYKAFVSPPEDSGNSTDTPSKIVENPLQDSGKSTMEIVENPLSHIIHSNTHKNTHHHRHTSSPHANNPRDKIMLKEDKDYVKNIDEKFEILWELYPKKLYKDKAKEAFMRVIEQQLVDYDTLLGSIQEYGAQMEDLGKEHQFIKSLNNWLADQRWTDVYPKKANQNTDEVKIEISKDEIVEGLQNITGVAKDIRLKILEAVNPTQYNTWFNDVNISMKEDRIEISYKSKFKKDYSETHFRFKIKDMLDTVPELADKFLVFKMSEIGKMKKVA